MGPIDHSYQIGYGAYTLIGFSNLHTKKKKDATIQPCHTETITPSDASLLLLGQFSLLVTKWVCFEL